MSSSAVKVEQIRESEESGDARGQGSAPGSEATVVSSAGLAGHIGEEADSRTHEGTMVEESDEDESEGTNLDERVVVGISTASGAVPALPASGAVCPWHCGCRGPSPSPSGISEEWMDRFRHWLLGSHKCLAVGVHQRAETPPPGISVTTFLCSLSASAGLPLLAILRTP